jgi:hypothetical protein
VWLSVGCGAKKEAGDMDGPRTHANELGLDPKGSTSMRL